MNTLSSIISVRVNPKTKKAAQKTLRDFGMDISSGVNLFLEQVVKTESIPFPIATERGHKLRHWEQYKKEIAWEKKYGKSYATAEEAFADIFKKK